jgi:hypothetical protein
MKRASPAMISAVAADAAGRPWKIADIVTLLEAKKSLVLDAHTGPNRNPNSAWPRVGV